jgi:hypothetical protein
MTITDTVRRSSLVMPVNQPRFVEKARRLLARAHAIAAKGGRKAEAMRLAGVP